MTRTLDPEVEQRERKMLVKAGRARWRAKTRVRRREMSKEDAYIYGTIFGWRLLWNVLEEREKEK